MIDKEPELGPTQRAFARCLVQLEAKILADGFEFTLGESYRSPEQAAINSLSLTDRARIRALLETKYPVVADAIGSSVSQGIKNSVHRNKLAQDLNLFKDGIFLEKLTDYQPFGEFWKSLHPLARWGGDFGDADHFSFTYQGIK
jgi:hypothetical protein